LDATQGSVERNSTFAGAIVQTAVTRSAARPAVDPLTDKGGFPDF